MLAPGVVERNGGGSRGRWGKQGGRWQPEGNLRDMGERAQRERGGTSQFRGVAALCVVLTKHKLHQKLIGEAAGRLGILPRRGPVRS